MKKISLPRSNKYGCYEIRLESIGGLGANLAGKILGEAGVSMGFDSASFSSYGSEKRGSPVKAHIRYSEQNIRISSPVINPDILAVFHKNLIGRENILSGTDENTAIVINTPLRPDDIELDISKGAVYTVDALKISMETRSRINTVILGAVAKASGFIPLEIIFETLRSTIGRKYPALLDNNIEGAARGYSEVCVREYHTKKDPAENNFHISAGWGYKNAPKGGVITLRGNMVSNDLSASREGYIPIFIKEKCINCGLCESTCPDMVFQFEQGEYRGRKAMVNKGPDYIHCKGCMRCVAICPTEALVSGEDLSDNLNSVPNRDLICKIDDYSASGASSYITSESDNNEKRADGGIV